MPNKFVIEQLQKHCDTTKKYMTALTEDELDVVLDSFTQERELASLDEYFADNQPDPKPQAAAEPLPGRKNPAGSKASRTSRAKKPLGQRPARTTASPSSRKSAPTTAPARPRQPKADSKSPRLPSLSRLSPRKPLPLPVPSSVLPAVW